MMRKWFRYGKNVFQKKKKKNVFQRQTVVTLIQTSLLVNFELEMIHISVLNTKEH